MYLKAYDKFEKAYAKDKKNSDILNYLGYTLRKTGDLEQAEIYYLKGLELDSKHLGINEYLDNQMNYNFLHLAPSVQGLFYLQHQLFFCQS